MGRYPFLMVSEKYLEKRKAFIAKLTYVEWGRKLRHLNSMLAELREGRKISTTSPKKLTREDVSSILEHMKEKNLESVTMEKYLMLISFVCRFVGNNVFTEMKAEGENFPKRTPKNLSSLTQEQVSMIIGKAGGIGGWLGDVAQLILAVYAYTGMRPSELRLAHFEDLDIRNWRIKVRHPKGEGSYGKQRTVAILPPARPAVAKFVKAREKRLKDLGYDDAEPLVPAKHGKEIGYYSGNVFRMLKAMVEKAVREDPSVEPIDFSLKTLRDTFCQMNIDMNPANLSAVSVQMGHATTNTTEKHYGRLKENKALEILELEWTKQGAKTPLIEAN